VRRVGASRSIDVDDRSSVKSVLGDQDAAD